MAYIMQGNFEIILNREPIHEVAFINHTKGCPLQKVECLQYSDDRQIIVLTVDRTLEQSLIPKLVNDLSFTDGQYDIYYATIQIRFEIKPEDPETLLKGYIDYINSNLFASDSDMLGDELKQHIYQLYNLTPATAEEQKNIAAQMAKEANLKWRNKIKKLTHYDNTTSTYSEYTSVNHPLIKEIELRAGDNGNTHLRVRLKDTPARSHTTARIRQHFGLTKNDIGTLDEHVIICARSEQDKQRLRLMIDYLDKESYLGLKQGAKTPSLLGPTIVQDMCDFLALDTSPLSEAKANAVLSAYTRETWKQYGDLNQTIRHDDSPVRGQVEFYPVQDGAIQHLSIVRYSDGTTKLFFYFDQAFADVHIKNIYRQFSLTNDNCDAMRGLATLVLKPNSNRRLALAFLQHLNTLSQPPIAGPQLYTKVARALGLSTQFDPKVLTQLMHQEAKITWRKQGNFSPDPSPGTDVKLYRSMTANLTHHAVVNRIEVLGYKDNSLVIDISLHRDVDMSTISKVIAEKYQGAKDQLKIKTTGINSVEYAWVPGDNPGDILGFVTDMCRLLLDDHNDTDYQHISTAINSTISAFVTMQRPIAPMHVRDDYRNVVNNPRRYMDPIARASMLVGAERDEALTQLIQQEEAKLRGLLKMGGYRS